MTTGRLRARLAREEGESGVALVELMVSMVVMLIMLTLIARMFTQVMFAADDNVTTRSGVGVASTVIDEVTRVVRQGARVSTSQTTSEGAVLAGSTATSLSVDSFVDAIVAPGQAAISPTRVVFSVDGSGNLVEQRYAGTVSGGYTTFSSTATSRTVNGPITTAAPAAPLFAYRDGSGAAVVPGSSGLTSAQAIAVASVVVTVTVKNALSRGDDPVVITNEVTMPNIAILNGGY
jgi:type II secretory pathway pseudopilin PulG